MIIFGQYIFWFAGNDLFKFWECLFLYILGLLQFLNEFHFPLFQHLDLQFLFLFELQFQLNALFVIPFRFQYFLLLQLQLFDFEFFFFVPLRLSDRRVANVIFLSLLQRYFLCLLFNSFHHFGVTAHFVFIHQLRCLFIELRHCFVLYVLISLSSQHFLLIIFVFFL